MPFRYPNPSARTECEVDFVRALLQARHNRHDLFTHEQGWHRRFSIDA